MREEACGAGLTRWMVGYLQATQGPRDWGAYYPVYAHFFGHNNGTLLPQGKKLSGLDDTCHGQPSAGHGEGFRFCSERWEGRGGVCS